MLRDSFEGGDRKQVFIMYLVVSLGGIYPLPVVILLIRYYRYLGLKFSGEVLSKLLYLDILCL